MKKDNGPIAQLGARLNGIEKVVSSNLTRSTESLILDEWGFFIMINKCNDSEHSDVYENRQAFVGFTTQGAIPQVLCSE